MPDDNFDIDKSLVTLHRLWQEEMNVDTEFIPDAGISLCKALARLSDKYNEG